MKVKHFKHWLIMLQCLCLIALFVMCFKYFIPMYTKINQSSILRLKFEYEMGERPAGDIRKQFKFTSLKEFKLKEDAIYRKQVLMANYRPIRNSAGINCKKIIINNDEEEISRSMKIIRNLPPFKTNLTTSFYLNITRNCDLFRESRGYIEHPLSKTEFEFPIAFSILVYKDIEQVERLIRAIYRPHNYYCIHIDSKMDTEERNAVTKIENCLNNVFISKESFDVTWANISLLEAELSCMKTLWPYKKWRYYINLAGQEFPLKTNREIIAILKVLDGANVVDGSRKKAKSSDYYRWAMKTTPPPHKISLIKGAMHIAANRYFVDSCIHDQKSLKFLEWLRETQFPEETYFPSLNHNPHLGILGSYLGEAEQSVMKPFFLRYVIWKYDNVTICYGEFVREVCIIGVRELYNAYNSFALFANKFYYDYEHIALDCLEEVLFEKTWQEYIEDIPVNTSYYRNLKYAKMQLKP